MLTASSEFVSNRKEEASEDERPEHSPSID